MSITIILVNYHSAVDLLEALASVEASLVPEGFTRKIVVVDNDCPSKLEEIPGVEILRPGKNLGFTGANNLAIKKIPSDYYLLLNPDTVVYKTFLIELLKPFVVETHDRASLPVGLASPKIYFYPGFEFYKNKYPKMFLGKVIWYAGGHKKVDKVDKPNVTISTEPMDTAFATGCCLLISREVREKIGLLDEKFFFTWEDVDYSLRAKKAGFRVVYVSRAVIWYKNTTAPVPNFYQVRDRLIFTFKYSKFPSCIFSLDFAKIKKRLFERS